MWRKDVTGQTSRQGRAAGHVGAKGPALVLAPEAPAQPAGPWGNVEQATEEHERRGRGRLRHWLGFPFRTPLRRAMVFMGLLSLPLMAWLALDEAMHSRVQARIFAALGRELYFWTASGPNEDFQVPVAGPYDRRLGYTHIPAAQERLEERGYQVVSQARLSPVMTDLVGLGMYPVYSPKEQVGLELADRDGQRIYDQAFPRRRFEAFEDIPDVVVDTLLFIENRQLLDGRYPQRNPAVEWLRLVRAIGELVARQFGMQTNVPGGSTLATQIEKFRHSEDGRTRTAGDKVDQMLTASLRAYRDGERTLKAQERIVLEYFNGVPLAAVVGFGEVHGMADGLWAWFGADFEEVMGTLRAQPVLHAPDSQTRIYADLKRQARAYRQVLSLLLAHRRPSHYLVESPESLHALTERYLALLAREGVISPALRDAALSTPVQVERQVAQQGVASFVERKAVDGMRAHLVHELGVRALYDLDRFDLKVKTTLDTQAQREVTQVLRKLDDQSFVSQLGLTGDRMLGRGDLDALVYSFNLYETTPLGNVLRVQADSYEQPLNINEQIKLDLGSTAKLRTLVTYLEVLAQIDARLQPLPAREVARLAVHAPDRLTRWVADWRHRYPRTTRRELLEAAMRRMYSGDPGERFFTGGGVHKFANFDNKRNGVMTVQEAFRHSVNLPFVRMMRDIVHHHMYQDPKRIERIFRDLHDPERIAYLQRFADKEGRVFQENFVRRYRGKDPEGVLEALAKNRQLHPRRLAVAYRTIAPDGSREAFQSFVRHHAHHDRPTDKQLAQWFDDFAPGKWSLNDLGYLAKIHPLELWTARHMRQHPTDSYATIMEASRAQRLDAYSWLLKTSRKGAQDKRLRIMLEEEAFAPIHASWSRLGYPFASLVPSYATSIGSSADRPAALAELVGILRNHGVRYPVVRFQELAFATGTPYETLVRRQTPEARRVLDPDVAHVALAALTDVAQEGTARRIKGAFVLADGTELAVGGKTGTGDHRHKRYAGGRLVESRAVNRTATFVFFLGERFFGTLTVFVPGEDAAHFRFTSALPVQLLKSLAPALRPLLERPAEELTTPMPDEPPVVAKRRISRPRTLGEVVLEAIAPAPAAEETSDGVLAEVVEELPQSLETPMELLASMETVSEGDWEGPGAGPVSQDEGEGPGSEEEARRLELYALLLEADADEEQALCQGDPLVEASPVEQDDAESTASVPARDAGRSGLATAAAPQPERPTPAGRATLPGPVSGPGRAASAPEGAAKAPEKKPSPAPRPARPSRLDGGPMEPTPKVETPTAPARPRPPSPPTSAAPPAGVGPAMALPTR